MIFSLTRIGRAPYGPRVRRSAALSLLTVVWLVATPNGTAQAATFLVNSTVDEHDATGADGLCETSGGSCERVRRVRLLLRKRLPFRDARERHDHRRAQRRE